MTWIVGFTKVIRQCVVTTSCCATVGEFLKILWMALNVEFQASLESWSEMSVILF